ncbi:MAG TPA: S41 family peptidase, partial [Allosphingosinicella sp.]
PDWKAAARLDILAAYDLYRANHTGMHDPANPAFPAQLDRARDAGLAYADRATDRVGYQRALGAFSGELQDGHAQLTLKQPANGSAPQYLWPGFVAAWRGNGLKVHSVDGNFPLPVGTRIEACDGKSPETFLKEKLLILNFRWREAGDWWFRAPRAFRPLLGAADKLEKCTFVRPNGKRETLALKWSPAPGDMDERLNRATDGERTPIGLTEPRPGLFLIGLPDFQPDAEGRKAYDALFAALKERQTELAKAKALVIDLRYNNGGSSSWSRRTANALWGEAAVEVRMAAFFKDVSIWWRASEGNTKYVAELGPELRRNGSPDIADAVDRIAMGMKEALAKKQPFYVEEDEAQAQVSAKPETPFVTPVYVITPGRCGSACLDALDAFTRFQNVKLIGAPTSADSAYMEIRSQDLPSGEGRIVIPNKMWVGKPRKASEVYRPQIEVDDLDWSTATFLDRIERDLASR